MRHQRRHRGSAVGSCTLSLKSFSCYSESKISNRLGGSLGVNFCLRACAARQGEGSGPERPRTSRGAVRSTRRSTVQAVAGQHNRPTQIAHHLRPDAHDDEHPFDPFPVVSRVRGVAVARSWSGACHRSSPSRGHRMRSVHRRVCSGVRRRLWRRTGSFDVDRRPASAGLFHLWGRLWGLVLAPGVVSF